MTKRVFWIGILFFSLPVLAERPTRPEPGEDRQLFANRTAREFFSERVRSACRQGMEETFEAYRREKRALASLVAERAPAAQIDARERTMIAARRAAIQRIAECGDCAARAPERRSVRTAARTEQWVVSDGSCQLPETDPAKLRRAFDTLRDSLQHLRRFPNKHGGFFDIVELIAVDVTAREFRPATDRVVSPSNAFIMIRGPELGLPMAFSYFFETRFETRGTNRVQEYIMTGDSIPPAGFPAYRGEDVTAGGTRRAVTTFPPLTSVLAQWYLTSDGYLRYSTSGDFSQVGALEFVERTSREIMLSTIFTLYERGKAAAE